jgi:hypothetical protein
VHRIEKALLFVNVKVDLLRKIKFVYVINEKILIF